MSDPNAYQVRLSRLERLHAVGLALSSERDKNRLMERILLEAKELCRADGGTLYLRTSEDRLTFEMVRTDSLGVALGGTTNEPVPFDPVPMWRPDGRPNDANVVSHCAHAKASINIADAYDARGFDFRGTRAFDASNRYRSKSILTIPMTNQEGLVIGVLQLLNAHDEAGDVVPFSKELQSVVEALAAQAAVALDNQVLLAGQRDLMEAFIKLIAAAIDAKSPYTGGHCRRVPILTEMLARAVCDIDRGPLSDFDLDDQEWYALHIAGWLHDCGKVTTPVHVMDKATKLETIFDRIELVNARFAALAREMERDYHRSLSADETELQDQLAALKDDRQFVERANVGGEFMSDAMKDRVERIARRTWTDARGDRKPLLTSNEVENLTVSRGTLTPAERLEINGHMVQTIQMLESLPFPRNLQRVPEYAGGHHERMDGNGYPRGVFGADMSIPARIMAIADVFEALTAQDRPYKKGKTLSESMRIMGEMKRNNHLDPDLFDVFVSGGVYRAYAERFLRPEQIDDVDEEGLIAIAPRPFDLPPAEIRAQRRTGFRDEYATLQKSYESP